MELKTKTATGLAVTAGGSSNLASGKISGNLETKWACKEQGLTGERLKSGVSSSPFVHNAHALNLALSVSPALALVYQKNLNSLLLPPSVPTSFIRLPFAQ